MWGFEADRAGSGAMSRRVHCQGSITAPLKLMEQQLFVLGFSGPRMIYNHCYSLRGLLQLIRSQ
jgi:hypothetical protein